MNDAFRGGRRFPGLRLRRDDHELAVAHAALADDMAGEMLDLGLLALEQRDFEAADRVHMDVQRRDGHVSVAVVVVGELLRELARLVVVDIDQRRDAGAGAVVLPGLLQQAGPDEVTHRFRAVLMAACLHIAVERAHQLVVYGHRHALHRRLCPSLLSRKF